MRITRQGGKIDNQVIFEAKKCSSTKVHLDNYCKKKRNTTNDNCLENYKIKTPNIQIVWKTLKIITLESVRIRLSWRN